MKSINIFFSLCIFLTFILDARSILRPKDNTLPQLIVQSYNGKKAHCITDSHIEEHPLFTTFDWQHFKKNRLPQNEITFRNNHHKNVRGDHLSYLIRKLICEIQSGQTKHADFTLLQNNDFNYKKGVGLAVFKFNNYPFVLKLFIETPESFVNPWMKGMQPVWFFYMGGGVNRHITGMTRIANKEYILSHLKQSPKWRDLIDAPRKWFWLPDPPEWILLTGRNIGGKDCIQTRIPATYAIVADYIEGTHERTIFDRHKRKIALEICNTLDMYVDAHIDNFIVERHSNKLVIIDTEHFPTLVGMKEKMSFKTYLRWYLGLTYKATHDIFFRTKKERKQAQFQQTTLGIFNYTSHVQ